MATFSHHDLQTATGGRWLSDFAAPAPSDAPGLRRVVIDSREARRGDVFWTLPGRHRHGAEFIADAFRRGADAAVAAESSLPTASLNSGDSALPGPVLAVDDAHDALRRLARYQRERFEGTVIAVTGSVGKTTTRQMLHTVLGSRWSGTASPRNYNNGIGVPLSMTCCAADDHYLVLEFGANRPGEIAELAALSRPRIGVITRIGEAHLGGFGGREAVAEAKAELLDAVPSDGWAVLNGDDPQLRRFKHRTRARIVWVGRGADCDFTATNVHYADGRLSFEVDGRRLTVPVWGRHHVTSTLAAAAVGRTWGLAWSEIAGALAAFESPSMRCEVIERNGAKIINDAYNASPAAMRAALELLRDFDAPGRRIVVCGDMRELGDESQPLHRELGDEVVTLCGADLLVACGAHAADVVAGARQAGMPGSRAVVCHDPLEAVPIVGNELRPGDVLLVKGSRSLAMERIVANLCTSTPLGEQSPNQ